MPQQTNVPCHLTPATKSDHHVRKCARRHNESAVATCAVEMRFEDLVYECNVNSNELAAHDRATPLIRHRRLTIAVRTPSVSTLFGDKNQSSDYSIGNVFEGFNHHPTV